MKQVQNLEAREGYTNSSIMIIKKDAFAHLMIIN